MYVQMTHFETWSDFADQYFGILLWHFEILRSEAWKDLETFQSMSPCQKKLMKSPIVIISEGVSLVQASSLYYIKKFRY